MPFVTIDGFGSWQCCGGVAGKDNSAEGREREMVEKNWEWRK